MEIKTASLKEFTLVILGKERPALRQKVFDNKDFILPGTLIGPLADRRPPKSRKEKMQAWARSPITDRQIEISTKFMRQKNPFHHLAKAIDTSKLTLSIPSRNLKISVVDFRSEASKAYPKMGINKAYDAHAKAQYGHSYSDLVSAARDKVIDRFKAAFAENLDHHPMNDEYHKDKDVFSHHPVWTPESSIKEYKSLAKRGHVYSQYLAGLFLASNAGGYQVECVEYLLMAYENKQPEAMRVLAEFLHFKNDYYGAMQCALLSVDGGDDHSKKIVREVLDECVYKMMQTAQGIAPYSFVLLQLLRQNGFDSILREHFSDLSPDARPEIRISGFRMGGRP